jgi:hypothetical protein
MAVAALVCGIVGVVIGLIPILGIGALALGLVAVVLGFISWRRGKAAGRKQGRAGIILGVVAIVLSVIGMVIVSNAFDDLEDGLDCLERADTAAEIEACWSAKAHDCVECGGYWWVGRIGGPGRGADDLGSWFLKCCGWWPDGPDGTRADEDQPARWRLTDDPLTITPVDRFAARVPLRGGGTRPSPVADSIRNR